MGTDRTPCPNHGRVQYQQTHYSWTPWVAPMAIHIQPLRGFIQFFSRPYLNSIAHQIQIVHQTNLFPTLPICIQVPSLL